MDVGRTFNFDISRLSQVRVQTEQKTDIGGAKAAIDSDDPTDGTVEEEHVIDGASMQVWFLSFHGCPLWSELLFASSFFPVFRFCCHPNLVVFSCLLLSFAVGFIFHLRCCGRQFTPKAMMSPNCGEIARI